MNDTRRLVAFQVDGHRYAVDLQSVRRVLPMVEVSPLPDGPTIALGVVNVHGEIIPVVDLRRRFGLPPRTYGLSAQLLVCRTRQRILAMPVDEVIGLIDRPETAVVAGSSVLPHLRHVSGVIPLEDDLLLLHDVDAFLSLDEERELDSALHEVNDAALT